jgi:glutaredoxin
MTDIDDERAEDRGYQRYRCPHCKRTIWTDTTPECDCREDEDNDNEG